MCIVFVKLGLLQMTVMEATQCNCACAIDCILPHVCMTGACAEAGSDCVLLCTRIVVGALLLGSGIYYLLCCAR